MSRIVEIPQLWCADCEQMMQSTYKRADEVGIDYNIIVFTCENCNDTLYLDPRGCEATDLRQKLWDHNRELLRQRPTCSVVDCDNPVHFSPPGNKFCYDHWNQRD